MPEACLLFNVCYKMLIQINMLVEKDVALETLSNNQSIIYHVNK